MFDVGGYYHFKQHPGEQFLFCYGHSVAGQTENYAYVGMYWTWGKDKNKTQDEHMGTLQPFQMPLTAAPCKTIPCKSGTRQSSLGSAPAVIASTLQM